MKSVAFGVVALVSAWSTNGRASSWEMGMGSDSAGPVGAHINADVQVGANWKYGLELGSRQYRFHEASFDGRSTIEGFTYAKALSPFNAFMSLFAMAGVGDIHLPQDSSQSDMLSTEFALGIRLVGKESFFELGYGARSIGASKPVTVGVDHLDRQLISYPTFTYGWTL